MKIRAAPSVPAVPGERTQPARLPAGIASVLSVLSSASVVLDGNDRVLLTSSAARAFGLVKGDALIVGELLALVRQVRRSGEIREGEIEVSTSSFNGRTTSFAVRVAPLGAAVGDGGLVLLLAEDPTQSRRGDRARRQRPARPVGARRRGPAHHRAPQPAGERGRLQPGEDPGGGLHPQVKRRFDRDQCRGPGHRHTRAGSGADLRAVLPGRPGQVAGDWRDRARAGHRQARHRRARRQGHGLEQGRRRIDLHPAAAAAARCPCVQRRSCPCDHAICQGGCLVTRVLVVEDEESFSDALSYMLRKEGFEVAVCPTGPDAIETFDRTGADLVLLDLMLPGLPGSEVCRTLRERSNVPVIMLTAKDSEIDKVVGLELGADDYVTKPFSSRELVARMRAVLRRRGESDEPAASIMESGPVRMDIERHVVTVRGGQVQLPLKEFELLEVLLRNAGRVLTRMQLIDRVWGADYVGDTKTLDVHVKRLRAKVEEDPARPTHIITVRGLGYKFEPGR